MSRRISIFLVLLALACFGAAGRQHAPLLGLRRTAHLAAADPADTPPLVAFTTLALSGFRGVMVDILWMRATRLQDEGKYFELVQLSDWITRLQPRFTSIWAFHAWNLSYNISVMMNDPEDRWRWVGQGIALLRDRGLACNPHSAALHRELAWILLHKVGGDLDAAHWTYKRHWAEDMTAALGGARPDFTALDQAPRTEAALRAAAPDTAALIDRLRTEGLNPLDPGLLTSPDATALRRRLEDDPAGAPLLLHLRSRLARETFRLEPALLREVDAQYGPFDWRLPQAHAIYWSHRGLPYARARFDRLSLDRMIFQSGADAFVRGRLIWRPEADLFFTAPNLDLLPRTRANYERALTEFPDEYTLRTAHENFLADAVMIAYTYNRLTEARDLFDDLRRRYPSERTTRGLEFFIAATFRQFAETMDAGQALAGVESAYVQSYFWRELGEEDQARGFANIALACWNEFMKDRMTGELRVRTGLPTLDEIRRVALERAREAVRAAGRRGPARPLAPSVPPPAPAPAPREEVAPVPESARVTP